MTMTSTGIFVFVAHHFILLWFNLFDVSVDSEGWWFEHSVGWSRVCLSGEGAKNVSRPWLSPLRGWGSLTMTSIGKFVYIGQHFILLRSNHFDLSVDSEGWWFEHHMS